MNTQEIAEFELDMKDVIFVQQTGKSMIQGSKLIKMADSLALQLPSHTRVVIKDKRKYAIYPAKKWLGMFHEISYDEIIFFHEVFDFLSLRITFEIMYDSKILPLNMNESSACISSDGSIYTQSGFLIAKPE